MRIREQLTGTICSILMLILAGCQSPARDIITSIEQFPIESSLISVDSHDETDGFSPPVSKRIAKHPVRSLQVGQKSQAKDDHLKLEIPGEVDFGDGSNSPRDIEEFVNLALENNPSILAARRTVSAMLEVPDQVTARPDPMLKNTLWPFPDNSPQTASGRGFNQFSISQKYPWKGKLRLKGEIASENAQIAAIQLEQIELEIAEKVRSACFEVLFLQKSLKILTQSESLLGRLIEVARSRNRTGGSIQDVYRLQSEQYKIVVRKTELGRDIELLHSDLNKLIAARSDLEILVKSTSAEIDTPKEIERLVQLAKECSPRLHEKIHGIVKNQYVEELAQLQIYPDFKLGLGWQSITGDEALSGIANARDNLGFTVEINLPIRQERIDAGIREARHRIWESQRKYENEEDETLRQIRRAMAKIRTAEKQISFYRDRVIPKAKQTLDQSLADYRVAKVEFVQVIDNWTDWLRFQIQLELFRTELRLQLVAMHRIVGCRWDGK